ncbi:MAG: hypothetical protein ACK4MS_11985 [Paracoccaceae bacterium]
MLSLVHLAPVGGTSPFSASAPAEQTAPRNEPPSDLGRAMMTAQVSSLSVGDSDASDRDFPGAHVALPHVAPAPVGGAGPTSDDVEAALAQARAASLAAQRAYRHAAMLESQSFSPAAAATMALFGRAAAIDSMAGSRADLAIPGTGTRVVPAGMIPEGRLLRRD